MRINEISTVGYSLWPVLPNELSGSSAHQSLTVRYNSTSRIAYFYRLSTIDSMHPFAIRFLSIGHSFVLLPRCGVFDTGYLRFFDSWILGNKFQKYPPLVEATKYMYDTRRLSEFSPFVEIVRRRIREMKTRIYIFFIDYYSPIYLFSSSKFDSEEFVINDGAKTLE